MIYKSRLESQLRARDNDEKIVNFNIGFSLAPANNEPMVCCPSSRQGQSPSVSNENFIIEFPIRDCSRALIEIFSWFRIFLIGLIFIASLWLSWWVSMATQLGCERQIDLISILTRVRFVEHRTMMMCMSSTFEFFLAKEEIFHIICRSNSHHHRSSSTQKILIELSSSTSLLIRNLLNNSFSSSSLSRTSSSFCWHDKLFYAFFSFLDSLWRVILAHEEEQIWRILWMNWKCCLALSLSLSLALWRTFTLF